MRILYEKGIGIRQGWKDMKFNKNNLSQFLVSVVFSLTGAVVVFVNVASYAGFTADQTTSFIAFSYIVAGIISVLMALYYKMPVIAMPTITAALVIGHSLADFTVEEIAGAFLVASAIKLVLGMIGVIDKLVKLLPIP